MTAPQTLPKSVMVAFGLSVLLAASPAPALDFFWNNLGGGNWDDPTNWTPDGPAFGIPQAGDIAYLTVSYFSPIPVSYNSPGDPALDGLYIDSNALLFQTDTPDGDLTTAFEIVGWDGRGIPQVGDIPPQGTHIQRGATTRVQSELILGLESEGLGTYQLLETGALQTGSSVIGDAGTGSFLQSGALTSHQTALDLILGRAPTGSGRYELAGPLSVGRNAVIGSAGVGELEQSPSLGALTVETDLILGRMETGQGTYRMRGGQLTVGGDSVIGDAGVGEFEQGPDTGRHTVANDLILGRLGTGRGTYRLTGGELEVAGDAFIGDFGSGTFEQTASTSLHSVGSRLLLFGSSVRDTEATYRLLDGELRVASGLGDAADPTDLVVAEVVTVGGDRGSIEQSGGTHFIGNPDRALSEAVLAIETGGRYELNDGELVVYGSAQIRNGTFLQTGGTQRIGVSRGGPTLSTSASTSLGVYSSGGTSRYLMHGGDLIVEPGLISSDDILSGSVYGGELFVGSSFQPGLTCRGTCEFVQSSGSVVAHQLRVGSGSDYQLSGDGSLRVMDRVSRTALGLGLAGGDTTVLRLGRFTQDGGQHTAQKLINQGTYGLQGGFLTVNRTSPLNDGSELDAVSNGGVFSFSGGGIVLKRGVLLSGDVFADTGRGEFVNQSGARLDVFGGGLRILDGDLRNLGGGTITLTDTDLVVSGRFSNFGSTGGEGAVLELDPSSIHFEGDVSNGTGGYFVADAGSSFQMGGDFINNSELNILWDTDEAGLIFDGEDAIAHVFALAGSDLGATVDGYLDNFAFGSLALAEDDSLVLVDGNATPGAALYVRVLEEAFDIGAVTSPFNIYYDVTRAENDWLGSGSYALNGGGSLLPIPEPGTATLVCLGLAGLGYRRRRV